jgi:hypothetical protein
MNWIVGLPIVVASLGAVSVASADPVRVEVVVPAAPAPRVEVIPARPSAYHTWVAGYWHWHPGERRWIWNSGYWMPHYVTTAPPVARIETPGPAPSPNHLWIKGYWKWNGASYEWLGGHWEGARAGYDYVHAHWDLQGGRYIFVPGYWRHV